MDLLMVRIYLCLFWGAGSGELYGSLVGEGFLKGNWVSFVFFVEKSCWVDKMKQICYVLCFVVRLYCLGWNSGVSCFLDWCFFFWFLLRSRVRFLGLYSWAFRFMVGLVFGSWRGLNSLFRTFGIVVYYFCLFGGILYKEVFQGCGIFSWMCGGCFLLEI